jgi:hypothetical protein
MANYLIPAAAFLVLIAIYYRFGNFRLKQLELLADRYHLVHTHKLPYDFPLELIDKRGWAGARHVFTGRVGNEELLVMDADIGFGRQAFTRTVAARRFPSTPASPKLPSNLVYAEVGPWRLAYARRSLLSPSAMMSTRIIEQV